MPVFTEIEAVPLTDRVAAALKDAFFSGKLKPGDAIVERQLAREMKVGTPVVREALISLQGQGFVRRVTNTGTFVTKFDAEEIRQLYALRIELEAIALQWARTRVTPEDIAELRRMLDSVAEAGEAGLRREFIERDFAFHKRCWQLSGNTYLAETLERLTAPHFAFAVMATGEQLTAEMARQHYPLVDALEKLQPPEFETTIRETLTAFASRWVSSLSPDSDGNTNA